MDSVAFLFPGQGSQSVGMGKNLYENSPAVRDLFDQSSEILGMDLARLCFEGPVNELNLTVNTQPAMLTVNRAAEIVLREKGFVPEVVAGHSLGEYSALVSSEMLKFTDALRLVRKRAEFMQSAVPTGEGAMAAIIGLDPSIISAICERVSESEGDVSPANYNCPGQIVIAGRRDYVHKAMGQAREEGATIAKELPVGAPSHCKLMEPAALKLAEEMQNICFSDPQIPLVANCDASIKRDGASVRDALIKQIAAPVYWEDSVRNMVEMGIKDYIEVGNGKVLTGIMRRIDRSLSCKTTKKAAFD